ncbi:hypothetical protein F3Y22_tig00117021pilonHSYRG00286 [Hibiscus syriacus]|uniref:Uncharacterized protein n=1 Tax=Hibiscus syriacus TaxID=106335 RepID=A0A6A2XHA0_HIBSY|nr:hypothetical protein F3Y22_tig00117021pilonHSYRG00286 [Hibiscus syriacus]
MVLLSLFLEQSSLMATDDIVIRKPKSHELSSRDELVHMATSFMAHFRFHFCHFISIWAMVIVKCETPCKTLSYTTQATTDEYGDCIFDLPSHLHGVINLEKVCSVKTIQIPKKSMCRTAPVKKHNA